MKTDESRRQYDTLHSSSGFNEEPEFYEVVAALVRGNKAVDIGCGEGHVERFCPDIVAVDFSSIAVENAKSAGAAVALQGDAQELPFRNDEFYVSLSNGTLEHIEDQEAAIREMARISRIQILIVHARLPFGLEYFRKMLWRILGWKDQPIEKPVKLSSLKKWLRNSGLRPIFIGFWNYIDLRHLWGGFPYGIVKIPSHHFIVSIKTPHLDRRFVTADSVKEMGTDHL